MRQKIFDVAGVAGADLEITSFIAFGVAGFTAVEMILTGLALQHFAVFGYSDPLGYGLTGLHLAFHNMDNS
ncbi:MAG: hypothetical protein BWY14_00368 [Parcubacteria group bacterium ADurb.Bin192]|nr:MAG: hypothetical protein BWY14_00368 [Parcubacteria group bacterium ADurb.Bin192]